MPKFIISAVMMVPLACFVLVHEN